jgi:hypothetical protein
MDQKAAAAGTENISGLEPNNNQSATLVLWKVSGIKLVKGKEHVKHFKMREKSKGTRSYCGNCNTFLFAVGSTLPSKGFGIPMNRAIITPEVPTTYRGLCGEAVAKSDLPKDSLKNCGFIPTGEILKVMGALMFGTGGPCTDPDFLEVLNTNVNDAETMPLETYHKLGFTSVK